MDPRLSTRAGEPWMEPDLRIAYDHLVRRGAASGAAGYVLTGERGSGLTVRRRAGRRVELDVEDGAGRHRFALLPTGSFVPLGAARGPWAAQYRPDRDPPEILLDGGDGAAGALRLPPELRGRHATPAGLMDVLDGKPVGLAGAGGLRGTLALGDYVGLDLAVHSAGSRYRVHWSDVWQEAGGTSPATTQAVWFRTYRHGERQWLEVHSGAVVLDRFDVTG